MFVVGSCLIPLLSFLKLLFSGDSKMKIFHINNTGSGFAEQIEVDQGASLGQLFAQKMPGCHPGDYLIRVNRQPAAADEVLTEECRVSITPTKIEGPIPA
jgi:hypothetical protein